LSENQTSLGKNPTMNAESQRLEPAPNATAVIFVITLADNGSPEKLPLVTIPAQ
jgi:hypothetical protein